jgi:hypothetical protein
VRNVYKTRVPNRVIELRTETNGLARFWKTVRRKERTGKEFKIEDCEMRDRHQC